MFNKVKGLWDKKSVKQVVALFSVNLFGIPLGIVTNILVTRYLGAELFGDYKLFCSIFNFAALFATVGFFQAGNRAIVQSKNSKEVQGLYGALLIILFGLYLLMSFGLLIYVHFDTNLANKNLVSLFASIIPLGAITLWGQLYETVLPADNKIDLLAKIRLWPKIINIFVASLLYLFCRDYAWDRLIAILLLYNGSQFLVFTYAASKIKPTFRNAREGIKKIFYYNKTFGFNVYVGSLFAVGLGYLAEIIISYFGANNADVGFYSLAITLSQPLAFIPSTIATTHYKSFATSCAIPRKLLIITLLFSGISVIALWVLIPPFVKCFYGSDFIPVIRINFFVCIAVFLHGIADFYNRFIQAKGFGILLRNASIIVGLATLISNLVLIPYFGANGAAYSKIINGTVYLGIIYYYYSKIISTNAKI